MDSILLLIPLLAALLGAGLGGMIVHFFTKSRDSLNQRRTLRIEYLISAYRALEDSGDRTHVTPEQVRAAEIAISDIVLLGHRREIEIAEEVLSEISANSGGSVLPLARALRASLRRELKLERVDTIITAFRWSPTNLLPTNPERNNSV
jgi:hypothetical protein